VLCTISLSSLLGEGHLLCLVTIFSEEEGGAVEVVVVLQRRVGDVRHASVPRGVPGRGVFDDNAKLGNLDIPLIHGISPICECVTAQIQLLATANIPMLSL
jgi:hypothetical protein